MKFEVGDLILCVDFSDSYIMHPVRKVLRITSTKHHRCVYTDDGHLWTKERFVRLTGMSVLEKTTYGIKEEL